MLALLWLACSGADDLTPPSEPFRGEAVLGLEGSHAGADDVVLGWVGWSRFREEARLTVVASDDAGVWDLIVVFEDDAAAGEHVPRHVFLKKGTQLFRDGDASCAATLSGSGAAGAPWGLSLSCTDLLTEPGSPNHEDRPFQLTATVSGETYTQDDTRAARFVAEGWFAGPQLVDSPAVAEGVVDFREPDLALVLPWRSGGSWLLFEDGSDESLDDVLLRVSPDENAWVITRWTRWGLDPTVGAALAVLADQDITMGVQGRDADQTGTAFSLPLWDSLQDDPDDELVVVVK